MNRNALLLGFLLFAPCAYADDPPQHAMSEQATLLPAAPDELFGPKVSLYDIDYSPGAQEQLDIYGDKKLLKTAFPPVDLGLGLYERGTYDPRPILFGQRNPVMNAFMAYGDFRVAGASYDAGSGHKSEIATRLNLDMDLALTATERFHAFVRPLDKGGAFTSFQFDNAPGQDKFVHEFNFDLKTLFFEGDLNNMIGGFRGKDSPRDLPIAVGRVPFATQNGIWIDDAFDGAAVGILTAKNSPTFDISNFDLTLFTGVNNIATAAVPGLHASKMFGAAGFFDGFKGYVEFGYGYVDADNHDLSYHNVTAAFTKRYMGKIANSIRVIGNFGQKAPVKTADGVLVLFENSLVRGRFSDINPISQVPYLNLFAGFKSPQSLARAADAGGVLRNTGINFESDGLTNYPTLDATAHDAYGGAIGYENLFDLHQQIVIEGSVLQRHGSSPIPGRQYAVGARYQHTISNAWIIRLDAMRGWRQGLKDIYGARIELRRKF